MTALSEIRILRAGDEGFAAATGIFNRAVTHRPALVLPCGSPEEVAAAVLWVRRAGLPLSVRAGGHNFAGHALVDGGAVLDLRALRGVRVDAAARTADVEPGLLWADYDAATAVHGLASPGGSISTVGVSGFTLGTGLGWLGRRHGLAADNLLELDLVTAEGERRTVGPTRDPELFWALRGGGGNFGVVTRLRFRLHPLTDVLAGTILVALGDAPEALRHLEQLAGAAPATAMWTAVFAALPPVPQLPEAVRGRAALLVNVCADPADPLTQRWLHDLERGMRVAGSMISVQPYPSFQRSADVSAPPGHGWDVRSEWLRPLDDRAVDDLCAAADSARSPLFELVLRPLGGAIADLPSDATAFAFRSADRLLEVIAGWPPDDPDEAEHRAWMQSTWAQLERLTAGGPDVNHLGRDESPERVRAAFGAAWERLRVVKRRLDPDDVFRSTQHVPL